VEIIVHIIVLCCCDVGIINHHIAWTFYFMPGED
jgi:hypothetical protein